jgi:hypothetical protein
MMEQQRNKNFQLSNVTMKNNNKESMKHKMILAVVLGIVVGIASVSLLPQDLSAYNQFGFESEEQCVNVTNLEYQGGYLDESTYTKLIGMCKHTPSTDVKPKLPAGDTGLEDIPQAQLSPGEEEDTQPIVPPATTGEIAPEADQPEAEEQGEEPQDEGQEEPSNEGQETSGPLT